MMKMKKKKGFVSAPSECGDGGFFRTFYICIPSILVSPIFCGLFCWGCSISTAGRRSEELKKIALSWSDRLTMCGWCATEKRQLETVHDVMHWLVSRFCKWKPAKGYDCLLSHCIFPSPAYTSWSLSSVVNCLPLCQVRESPAFPW